MRGEHSSFRRGYAWIGPSGHKSVTAVTEAVGAKSLVPLMLQFFTEIAVLFGSVCLWIHSSCLRAQYWALRSL